MKRSDLARVNELEALRSKLLMTLACAAEGKLHVVVGFEKVDDKALVETITDDVRDCLRRKLDAVDHALGQLGLEAG
jgi:hypothetical protein